MMPGQYFFPNVVYFNLFVALFFLPGFFITIILGIRKFRFLLSLAFSYSLLALTVLPFEYFGWPIIRWQWCVFGMWMILAVWAALKIFMLRGVETSNIQHSTFNTQYRRAGLRYKVGCWKLSVQGFRHYRPAIIRRLFSSRLLIPLVLTGMVGGYLAYAGPYLEIPSDVLEHVRRFRWMETDAFREGGCFHGSFMDLLGWRFRWNFFHAWLCRISGLPVVASLGVLTFLNDLIFLLAIYYFALVLFAGLRIGTVKKQIMAAFASLFAAATMGNMVFAYIRYYAFAPTILNYVVFLAAMAVIMEWLKSARWSGHALWIAPLLTITAALVHVQEALFIFFMTLSLALPGTAGILWRRLGCLSRTEQPVPPVSSIGQVLPKNRRPAGKWKHVILTVTLLLVFLAAFAAIRHFKPGSWVSADMIMPHAPIPSEPVNLIFRNLMISPPHNPWLRLAAYQLFVFYQTIGLWGLFVYFLFFLTIRRFVRLPYLLAGMIFIPFLTAFNPLFVDMMVRLGQEVTLYRFHYLLPLPFVAGYLFVHCLAKTGKFARQRTPASMMRFAMCLPAIFGLIVFVFPINAAGIYAPYSKIYTLRKIPAGNDCRMYDDLMEVIAQYNDKVVLSDAFTANLLWDFFPKRLFLPLRWLGSANPDRQFPASFNGEFSGGRGVIVVNCRDGASSVTGRISGHWPEDALMLSGAYSRETLSYLESHSEKFLKIWDQNRIAIYSIR